MQIPKKAAFCVLQALVFTLTQLGWAQTPEPAESLQPIPEATPLATKAATKKPRGKYKSEKEADGTQAPNRFDPGIINKSKYELDGQPLEVDTD